MTDSINTNPYATANSGPQLTPISADEELTNHKVTTLIQEVMAFLTGIGTTRGGGNHGHTGLITNDIALYNELTNNATPFEKPDNPGPPDPPEGSTAFQLQQYNHSHALSLTEWHTCKRAELQAKLAILKCVADTHYSGLKHRKTGHANTTTANLIDHLRNQCPQPKRKELQAIRAEYDKSHDMSLSVKSTLDRMKTCQDQLQETRFAVSDNNLLMDALTCFERTDNEHFIKQVQIFEARPTNEQTWTNLLKDMKQAEFLQKTFPKTSSTAGFAGATEQKMSPVYSYCFTHGLTRNPNHTSKTCKNPCDAHRTDATLESMMGGATHIVVPKGYRCLVPKPERKPRPPANPANDNDE